MAGRTWKRCFSTWRAAAGRARPPNDTGRYWNGVFAQSCRRNGATLLVSAALVLAAHSRPDLLADRADADVGFSTDLYFAERRIFRAGQRRVHRRGPTVGYPVSWSARVLDF